MSLIIPAENFKQLSYTIMTFSFENKPEKNILKNQQKQINSIQSFMLLYGVVLKGKCVLHNAMWSRGKSKSRGSVARVTSPIS